jgi:hypothetical protein
LAEWIAPSCELDLGFRGFLFALRSRLDPAIVNYDGLGDAVVNRLVVRMDEVLEEAETQFQRRCAVTQRPFDAMPQGRKPGTLKTATSVSKSRKAARERAVRAGGAGV